MSTTTIEKPQSATDHSLMVKTWEWLCAEPFFEGLPYRFEVSLDGTITMSPTKNPHGIAQFRIGQLMEAQGLGGEVGVEISTKTPLKMYEVDVCWCSHPTRLSSQDFADPAADICVEVRSRSNTDKEFTEKRDAYFAAGAREVWFVDRKGQVSFYGYGEGKIVVAGAAWAQLERSQIMPKFPRAVT